MDIYAPGEAITSSTITGTNTYGANDGTSMAAPHVTGAAALYLAGNPTAKPSSVASALSSNSTKNIIYYPWVRVVLRINCFIYPTQCRPLLLHCYYQLQELTLTTPPPRLPGNRNTTQISLNTRFQQFPIIYPGGLRIDWEYERYGRACPGGGEILLAGSGGELSGDMEQLVWQ